MDTTIETTLLLNLFYFENETFERNEEFIQAKRKKAIAMLDADAQELQKIDSNLAKEYIETIHYLESISDEAYQYIKDEIMDQVIVKRN